MLNMNINSINKVTSTLVLASCALAKPWEAMVIGVCSSLLTNGICELLSKLKIDDPVGEYERKMERKMLTETRLLFLLVKLASLSLYL